MEKQPQGVASPTAITLVNGANAMPSLEPPPPGPDQADSTYDATKEPGEERLQVDVGSEDPVTKLPADGKVARLGGPVPPLSEASNIPFFKENPTKLETTFVHWLPEEVPSELQDIQSPLWKDGKFLLQTFLVLKPTSGRRTKCKIQIPHCLLFSAKTLLDRVTVVNFWLSQRRDEQLKMIRNREEGLLKYYMQLKDTRENTFRQAYISGNPLQRLQKNRERQCPSLSEPQPPPEPPKDIEQIRIIVVDERSSCLDYILPPSLMCAPCDRFRKRFLPPHHRDDHDKWPLYKDRRLEIDETQVGLYTCCQLFDTTKEVGRSGGHKKKRILDFLQEKRVLHKTSSFLEWQSRRTSKPCFGLSGEGVRRLILQAAEQANRRAVLRDETIPDGFGLPDCYHNRSGFENVIVRKEERLTKVYSRDRSTNKHKRDAPKSGSGDEDAPEREHSVHEEVAMEGTACSISSTPTTTGEAHEATGSDAETAQITAPFAGPEKDAPPASAATSVPSRHHYVIRSSDCAGVVDTEKGHKLCKACTEAAVMVRSVARDAAKPLNLTKGAALTKLDLAKLVTSPELIETTIRSLRQLRAKDMKMARKELQRLRDRAGIPKQIRRKPNGNNNAGVAEQLHHVEQQVQEYPQHQQQPQPQPEPLEVVGLRRYEVGDHEVFYDSDDPAQPRDYGCEGSNPVVATMVPRGAATIASPSKRARTHY